MNRRILYIIGILLFLILLLCIINRKNEMKDVLVEGYQTMKTLKEYFNNHSVIETFAAGLTKTQIEQMLEEESLTPKQSTQIQNMINQVVPATLRNIVNTNQTLITGPQGPPGQQGPPGTTLIASGRLINKDGSFNPNVDKNVASPSFVVTRTEGTNATSSLSFMDSSSNFAPFQEWQLNINNNIVNRYDGTCLTKDPKQDTLYMSTCDPNNANQKWNWDNKTNRLNLISSNPDTSANFTCIGLTPPENNILTTNVPGCTGDTCSANTARRYLTAKQCSQTNVNEDEIWGFY
jgi:hypothetical protein